MSAAVDARGLKRVCSECGVRFYDLNKRPITCPSCETEFTGEVKTKGRKGRAAIEEEEKKAAAKAAKEKAPANTDNDEDEIEEEDDGIEEVSLEDVAKAEASDDKDDSDDETAALGDIDEDLDEDLDDDLDEATLDGDLDDDLDEDLADVAKSKGSDD